MTAGLLARRPIAAPLIPQDRGTRIDYHRTEVHLNGPVWMLNDQVENMRIDWTRLGLNHRGLLEATADFMVDRIVSSSASNVENHFRAICRLQRLETFRAWSGAPLPQFRPELTHACFYEARDRAGWSRGELSHLQRWFVFCAHREGSGVAAASARILGGTTIGGDPKAVAVLTSDPREGPLDDAETTALLQALIAARKDRSIELAGLAAVWLCVILGPNARHLALLREEDFKRIDGRHAELAVPRIKGKDAVGRQDFRRRKLDDYAADLIEELIAENARRRRTAPWTDERFAFALFPRETPRTEVLGRPQHAYAMHRTPGEISRLVSGTVARQGVVSPRTGESLAAGPRRFRYTLATRLLREGASMEVIRDLLDHSDLQTLAAYVNLRADIVEKLDLALALELAPVAQAFMGTLVTDENSALRGNTRTSRIFALDRETCTPEAVGTCGSFSFCGLAAPRACYTCVKFQPWIDGPHEVVLRTLLSDRDERRSRGLDGRLVSMNDQTILAVADVVRRCAEFGAPLPGPAPGEIADLDDDGEI